MTYDLIPCPFCGGEAKLHDHRLCWSVQCITCNASVVGDRVDELESEEDEQAVDWGKVEQTAIAAWNTRTDDVGVIVWFKGVEGNERKENDYRKRKALRAC